jgi:hypothetical protein
MYYRLCQYLPMLHCVPGSWRQWNFSWFDSNLAVATVTVKGVMTTVSDIGVSVVYACDVLNQMHYGTMKVRPYSPPLTHFTGCEGSLVNAVNCIVTYLTSTVLVSRCYHVSKH